MSRKLKPVAPDQMLAEEFLKPLGISNYRLAKEVGVPAQRVGEILARKHAITADSDMRLWPLRRALGRLVVASAGRLRQRGREGEPREDSREDQTVEGSSGADDGCVPQRRDGKTIATKIRCDNTLGHLIPASS